MAEKKRGRGKPKTFETAEQLQEALLNYGYRVKAEGYAELPTKTNFVLQAGCDRKTLYNALYKYFPDVKKCWNDLLSDLLTEGAALGKYNNTMVIFCLKNWCGWTDKMETDNTQRVTIEDYLRSKGEGQSM